MRKIVQVQGVLFLNDRWNVVVYFPAVKWLVILINLTTENNIFNKHVNLSSSNSPNCARVCSSGPILSSLSAPHWVTLNTVIIAIIAIFSPAFQVRVFYSIWGLQPPHVHYVQRQMHMWQDDFSASLSLLWQSLRAFVGKCEDHTEYIHHPLWLYFQPLAWSFTRPKQRVVVSLLLLVALFLPCSWSLSPSLAENRNTQEGPTELHCPAVAMVPSMVWLLALLPCSKWFS